MLRREKGCKRNARKESNRLSENEIIIRNVTDDIVVTKHALERMKLRSNHNSQSDANALNKIVQYVKQSIIIGWKDDAEIRSYDGFNFVCKREEKNMKSYLYIISVCLSEYRQRQFFSESFDENIDYVAMQNPKGLIKAEKLCMA